MTKFDKTNYNNMAQTIANQLEDDKASDVLIIDLGERSDIAFYMIIATGRSAKHVTSLANKIIDNMRTAVPKGVTVEGMASGSWVLVDFGGIIVHIFQQEARELYRIEDLWYKKPNQK